MAKRRKPPAAKFRFTKADFAACRDQPTRSTRGKCMAERVRKRLREP